MNTLHKTLTIKVDGTERPYTHDSLEDALTFAREEAEWEYTVFVQVIEVATGKLVETVPGLYSDDPDYDDWDGYTDAEADAATLASAGMGTDEDYGYFGGEDY